MGKAQLHTVFELGAALRDTAYMVQIDNMRSATMVKRAKFRKLPVKLCAADADEQSFTVFKIETLIFIFRLAIVDF